MIDANTRAKLARFGFTPPIEECPVVSTTDADLAPTSLGTKFKASGRPTPMTDKEWDRRTLRRAALLITMNDDYAAYFTKMSEEATDDQ